MTTNSRPAHEPTCVSLVPRGEWPCDCSPSPSLAGAQATGDEPERHRIEREWHERQQRRDASEPGDLGLNLDMLDSDRLAKWADNIEQYGNDLSQWASRDFMVKECRQLSESIRAEVRDVGRLRDLASAPPLSPLSEDDRREAFMAGAAALTWGGGADWDVDPHDPAHAEFLASAYRVFRSQRLHPKEQKA